MYARHIFPKRQEHNLEKAISGRWGDVTQSRLRSRSRAMRFTGEEQRGASRAVIHEAARPPPPKWGLSKSCEKPVMTVDGPSQEDSSATTQGPVCCRQRSGALLRASSPMGRAIHTSDPAIMWQTCIQFNCPFWTPQVGAV